jgi:hypothetical protein
MNTTEYNAAIQAKQLIGGITWKYNGKCVFADVLEIEDEFEGEYFLRIRALHCMPLVRVLVSDKSTRIYFLTERSSNGELDWPEFETAGIKCSLSIH